MKQGFDSPTGYKAPACAGAFLLLATGATDRLKGTAQELMQ